MSFYPNDTEDSLAHPFFCDSFVDLFTAKVNLNDLVKGTRELQEDNLSFCGMKNDNLLVLICFYCDKFLERSVILGLIDNKLQMSKEK